MKAKTKKRQDDFQKVKLKVGKKKPKADNATNTNFKSKSINLSEQLKRDKSGPTTHRHLGINDLLTQLLHHNANVKEGALVGLRELLSTNPSLLEQHLSRLLSEVAAVFTDKDAGVRAAATRLLRFIAQCVPSDRGAPFFPLLSAHLTCAMTHIDTGIQGDAMKVLDVLLEHYPALLAAQPALLLTNFLELISHRSTSGGAKKLQDVKGRSWSLSINPNRTVTGQQWQLTVLLRLARFLQAVVDERPVEEGDVAVPTEGPFGSCGEGVCTPLELNWEEITFSKAGVKVYELSGAKPTPRSTYRLRAEVDPGTGVGKELSSAEAVQSFATTLVPLLLEVWVEATANDDPSNDPAHLSLSPDSMSLMFQVLSILQLLRKLAPQREHQETLDTWFRDEYLRDFKQHFMKNFPYSVGDAPKHRKKLDKRIKSATAAQGQPVEPLDLNITLCKVMVSLSQSQDSGQEVDSDWLIPLKTFVKDCLSKAVKLNYRQLHMLLDTVWKMVQTQRSKKVTEDLLAAVNVYYQQKNLELKIRSLLLSFYSRLYLQEQGHTHIGRSKMLCRWLSALPVQLSQLGHRNPPLSRRLILSIQAAASRGNKDLLNSLQTHACKLYDPQEGVLVLLPAESQQRLVQLLYFLPALPQPLLANLSRCCTAGRISAGLASSLIRVIHLRSSLSGWSVGGQQEVAAVRDVDYFSFLFSTLAGFSGDELAALQEAGDESPLPPAPLSPLSLFTTPLEQFTHHWDIVEEVCHCLETLGSQSQCFDIVQSGICKYLTQFAVVPDSMAAGLLRAMARLMDMSLHPNEQVLRFLSQCCLSLLALLVTLQQEAPSETNHKREAIWGACVAALGTIPRLLRTVLQLVRVGDLCEEELPQLGQMLSMILQHTPLRNTLMTNATLIQHIIQDLTRYCRGETREQWLSDLLYITSITMTSRGAMGLRDMY